MNHVGDTMSVRSVVQAAQAVAQPEWRALEALHLGVGALRRELRPAWKYVARTIPKAVLPARPAAALTAPSPSTARAQPPRVSTGGSGGRVSHGGGGGGRRGTPDPAAHNSSAEGGEVRHESSADSDCEL